MFEKSKSRQKIFLIYGPPGAGKTSIALEICKREGWNYISVGEITRREISKGTDLGNRLRDCLEKVVEYPPELIAEVMDPYITKAVQEGRFLIIDGYPKYKKEIPLFCNLIREIGLVIAGVAVLTVDFEEALKRSRGRRVCESCGFYTKEAISRCIICGEKIGERDDDEFEIFSRRFRDHLESIQETIEALRKEKPSLRICEIDANPDFPTVLEEVYNFFKNMPG